MNNQEKLVGHGATSIFPYNFALALTATEKIVLAPTSELQKNYKNAVFDALTQFQFVESLLRDCIILSYKIIQEKTKESLDFTYSESGLNKNALHALCTKYKTLTKNKGLVNRIRSKADERNRIAHEACFQNWKDKITGIGDADLHTKGYEIQLQADEASGLVSELLKEQKKLKLELEQLTSASTG